MDRHSSEEEEEEEEGEEEKEEEEGESSVVKRYNRAWSILLRFHVFPCHHIVFFVTVFYGKILEAQLQHWSREC